MEKNKEIFYQNYITPFNFTTTKKEQRNFFQIIKK